MRSHPQCPCVRHECVSPEKENYLAKPALSVNKIKRLPTLHCMKMGLIFIKTICIAKEKQEVISLLYIKIFYILYILYKTLRLREGISNKRFIELNKNSSVCGGASA